MDPLLAAVISSDKNEIFSMDVMEMPNMFNSQVEFYFQDYVSQDRICHFDKRGLIEWLKSIITEEAWNEKHIFVAHHAICRHNNLAQVPNILIQKAS